MPLVSTARQACRQSAVSARYNIPECSTTIRSWSFFSNHSPQSQASSTSQQDTASADKGKDKVDTKVKMVQEVDKKPKVSNKKSMAQMDEELKLAMEGMAGDGGTSGVEFEDGKPVAMKRGVRDNMFRYI